MSCSRLFPLSLIQLLLVCFSVKSGVGAVGDEQCLLQTKTTQTRRSQALNETEEEDQARNKTEDEKEDDRGGSKPQSRSRPESRKLPEFTISLDDAPEARFNKISEHFKEAYLKMHNTWAGGDNAEQSAKEFELFRGPESDTELMGEIKGLAKGTGISEAVMQSSQLAGNFQTLKGPYFTYLDSVKQDLPSDESMAEMAAQPGMAKLAKQFESMSPQEVAAMTPSFGCTGILARDSADGTVWHARNLDYSFSHYVQDLAYNAKFTKGGKELFTGQMVFPYVMPLTAIRKGKNGYTYEMNSRFADTTADAQAVMINIFQQKRPPSGWSARKILEQTDNYEDAVKAFSTTAYPSREYNIISGVKKGTILARSPDGVDYQLTLGPKDRYIVMTNYDYTKNDKKEFIRKRNPSGLTPRVRAQKLLDDTSNTITPEFLHSVLNDDHVMEPTTLFQAVMNVEKGSYESLLPACDECSKGKGGDHAINFLQADSV